MNFSVYDYDYGNKIVGFNPDAENTQLNFNGKNNILFCEKNVRFVDSTLNFYGDNSLIYICENISEYKLNISIYNNSVFHIGRHAYINDNLSVIISEQKHCFISEECLISSGINIRNADPHLIYDCSSKKRINDTKSIYIGDHVWLGQNSFILKGTQIDSGCIIGAMSVVAGKKISHNECWAGNPCKRVKQNIFWDNRCVHSMTDNETNESMDYHNYAHEKSDKWVYRYDEHEVIEWNELEKVFSSDLDSMKKCEYLIEMNEKSYQNRFVHK